MKKFGLIIVVLVFCIPAFASNETQLQKAANVVNEIMSMETRDQGIPHSLLAKAVCVGIIPSEFKGAFIVGGSYGRGVLVCRKGGDGDWGAPSLFTLGGASLGFQIGGKTTDVVFLVMNPGGITKLVADSVKLGADLSVAGGPVGRSAEAATDAQLHAEILSYSRSRGLFAGVSLQGAVLKQDWDDNQKLYGRRVSAKQILVDGTLPAPPAARPLDRMLAKYSPRGGQRIGHG